jgi:hypothetical protein
MIKKFTQSLPQISIFVVPTTIPISGRPASGSVFRFLRSFRFRDSVDEGRGHPVVVRQVELDLFTLEDAGLAFT